MQDSLIELRRHLNLFEAAALEQALADEGIPSFRIGNDAGWINTSTLTSGNSQNIRLMVAASSEIVARKIADEVCPRSINWTHVNETPWLPRKIKAIHILVAIYLIPTLLAGIWGFVMVVRKLTAAIIEYLEL